jgi:L-rhamnose-H+ transport protein
MAEGVMMSSAPEERSVRAAGAPAQEAGPAPLASNYFFSALAGVTWYLQFFFYSMGLSKMGQFHFVSWALHMSSIIIFGTLWGIAFHEWRGTSKRTHVLIGIGLLLLVSSTIIMGYGLHLKDLKDAASAAH